MKKAILTTLLLTVCTISVAVEKDGVEGKSAENVLCQIFKFACTKVDSDSTGGKFDNRSVDGKSRDRGNDRGIPPDTQSTRSSGAVGSASDIKIRGAS